MFTRLHFARFNRRAMESGALSSPFTSTTAPGSSRSFIPGARVILVSFPTSTRPVGPTMREEPGFTEKVPLPDICMAPSRVLFPVIAQRASSSKWIFESDAVSVVEKEEPGLR